MRFRHRVISVDVIFIIRLPYAIFMAALSLLRRPCARFLPEYRNMVVNYFIFSFIFITHRRYDCDDYSAAYACTCYGYQPHDEYSFLTLLFARTTTTPQYFHSAQPATSVPQLPSPSSPSLHNSQKHLSTASSNVWGQGASFDDERHSRVAELFIWFIFPDDQH